MRPTLRQLQYLVAVSETGRFNLAARRMNVSQPSLSAQIADMEIELGTTLVERGRHGAVMTPAGEQVVRRARQILHLVEELRSMHAGGPNTLSGHIRLGVIPSIGPYLLPNATRSLHEMFPELRLSVHEGRTVDIDGNLRNGRLDLLISTAEDHPDCSFSPLFKEHLWICVPPDAPLANSRRPVRLRDLKGHSLLSLEHGHHMNLAIHDLARQSGAFVSTEYEGTSLDAIRQMAAMGAGIAVLPSLYALVEAKRDSALVVRRIDHRKAERDISLIWRDTSPMRDQYEQLADVLRQSANNLLSQATDQ
jgi:LysR family hydrogen peroxide-inducible transcriptional activator